MKNGGDDKDHRVMGGNPCLEQTLESYELCCLVETFPNNHDSLEDYQRTLKYAYLYRKTVTLGRTHWSETNRVMLRNRRIGCSVSGVIQFITKQRNMNLEIGWRKDMIQSKNGIINILIGSLYQTQSRLLQLNLVVQFHYWLALRFTLSRK